MNRGVCVANNDILTHTLQMNFPFISTFKLWSFAMVFEIVAPGQWTWLQVCFVLAIKIFMQDHAD